MPRYAPFALSMSLLSLSACAATTGRAWVHEPEDANLDTDAAYAALDLEPVPGSVPEAQEQMSDAPRPRLAHVVSLGQSESSAPRPTAPAAPGCTTPSVVVNVVNYGCARYAAGYGYPLTYRTTTNDSAPPRASSSSSTPSLGQDWARPPSYGPSFPWHTGPASPWERSR
jgi:hypothetical protein